MISISSFVTQLRDEATLIALRELRRCVPELTE
jgi:hypothetical protein